MAVREYAREGCLILWLVSKFIPDAKPPNNVIALAVYNAEHNPRRVVAVVVALRERMQPLKAARHCGTRVLPTDK